MSVNPWKKSFSEIDDQRDIVLPPALIKRSVQVHQYTETFGELFVSGRNRSMASAVIDMLHQAREKVVVSSFLLADKELEDVILAVARKGVRVYVLLASEARLGKEDSEGEFEKAVLAQHKEMLKSLVGYALFRSAPHFHAKLVVVDPDTNPAGMLMTANLTKEALERNEELAIRLTPSEVSEAVSYLKWAMWESAEHEMVDPKQHFRAVSPLGIVPHPESTASVVATTSKSNSLREMALALIKQARKSIVVSSFGWDKDHSVVRLLCERARSGISMTVLARERVSSMPALVSLAEAGAKVLTYRWLHAKAIWTDGDVAMAMSANLQADGLDHGFELGLKLSGARAALLKRCLDVWIQSAPYQVVDRPKLGDLEGKVRLWRDKRLEEVDVQRRSKFDLGDVVADSADQLVAPRPLKSQGGPLQVLAHEIEYRWSAVAPSAVAKAKEVRPSSKNDTPSTPFRLPVLREPGGRVVVAVKSPKELSLAHEVKAESGATAIVLAQGVLH